MKTIVLMMILVAGITFGGEPKGKYVILLQAGNETNEGAARAVHALLYAKELAENDYAVTLIFDGAAAGWAYAFAQPESPFNKTYVQMEKSGVLLQICDYCSEKFEIQDKLSDQQKTLLAGDYEGHPSLLRWIKDGYQVISL